MLESEITLNKSEQLKQLNTFLVNNPELEQLSAKLSIFNMLSVLKIERAEIRHSNILAWLLDPQGSHGLGQTIIQRLMSSILLENEDYEINITPVQIELMNMADVEVLREWRNIDLLIISHSNKWVLLIENKVRSKVSKKQLLRYLEIVKKEFLGYVTIPVILTRQLNSLIILHKQFLDV